MIIMQDEDQEDKQAAAPTTSTTTIDPHDLLGADDVLLTIFRFKVSQEVEEGNPLVRPPTK
jgi:hypothetical protein